MQGGYLAVPYTGEKIVHFLQRERLGHLEKFVGMEVFGEVETVLTEFTLTNIAAENNAPLTLLGLDPVTNSCSSPRSLYGLQPILTGHVFGRGNDLDDVAIA